MINYCSKQFCMKNGSLHTFLLTFPSLLLTSTNDTPTKNKKDKREAPWMNKIRLRGTIHSSTTTNGDRNSSKPPNEAETQMKDTKRLKGDERSLRGLRGIRRSGGGIQFCVLIVGFLSAITQERESEELGDSDHELDRCESSFCVGKLTQKKKRRDWLIDCLRGGRTKRLLPPRKLLFRSLEIVVVAWNRRWEGAMSGVTGMEGMSVAPRLSRAVQKLERWALHQQRFPSFPIPTKL